MTSLRLRLLAFALIPSLAFGAANQIRIGQTNAGGTAWIDRIFNTTPNSLIGTNASGIPQIVTVGEGLSLVGGELTATGVGAGTITSVSVVTANGVSASIADATTTPAFTFTLGDITPSSVVATGTVTGSNLSGTNTGDQTSVTGNAGTATALATARNINGVAFDGTANITVTAAAGTLTGTTLNSSITASSLTSAAGGSFGTAAYTNATAYAAIGANTFTGIQQYPAAEVTTANALGALAIDVTKILNTKSISADSTFTFSGTPANSNQWFTLKLTNTDTAAHTITIPSSYSLNRQASVTSFVIGASGVEYITWSYDGSVYRIFGDPTSINDLTADASPDSAADYVMTYDSSAGVAKKVLLSDLPSGSGTDSDAIHVNTGNEISGITSKATPTTSDLLVIEDAAASNAKKKITAGALPVSTATQDAIDEKVSDIAYNATTWDGDTDHAPSMNVVRDKIEALTIGGATFDTKMAIFWPTADLGAKPSGWIEGGTSGAGTGGTVGDFTLIVKSAGDTTAPGFSPSAGSFSSTQNVTITSGTSGATIKYTVDGSTPSRSVGTTYSTPVAIASTATLKAIAYKDYYADSSVTSGTYTISAAAYLLESVTAGMPAGAWSSYLRLAPNATYATTSPIIKVVDTTTGTETDVGASEDEITVAELEALATGGHDLVVKTVYDQSGHARDLTQATSGSRPLIVSAGTCILGPNSKPAMRFDGTDDTISFSRTVSLPVNFFVVVKNRSTTSNANIVNGGSSSRTVIRQNTTGPKFVANSGVILNGPNYTVGAWYLVRSVFTGTTSDYISINDSANTTGASSGTNTVTGYNIGTAAVDVQLFITYDSDISDSDEALLEAAINAAHTIY